MAVTFFSKRFWFYFGSLLLAVILLWGIFKGINNGRNFSQADLVIKNAMELKKSVQFFYNDQNRYPTANEFADKNVMGSYMNNFPPQDFISSVCEKSFEYKRPDPQNFQLYFCLPIGTGSYQKGWNQLVK